MNPILSEMKLPIASLDKDEDDKYGMRSAFHSAHIFPCLKFICLGAVGRENGATSTREATKPDDGTQII